MNYVSLDGQEISQETWLGLIANNAVGFILAENTVPGEDREVTVRTTWIGMAIPGIDVRPFGTAVTEFPKSESWRQLEQYDNRRDALRGHSRWLNQLTGKD